MMKRRQNPKRGTHFEEYVLIKILLGQYATNAVLFSFVSFRLYLGLHSKSIHGVDPLFKSPAITPTTTRT